MIRDNKVIIEYLKNQKYNIKTEYYNYIDLWARWYKNYVKEFHEYHDQNGNVRELYKLGMAKKLCEDWSSVLYTERDEVICNKTENQEYLDLEFKKKKFEQMVAENIEKAFYSGTLATTIRINNAILENNELIGDEATSYDFVNMTAEQIVPLKVDNGRIVDVAFISNAVKDGKTVYYLEIHEKVGKEYVIKNIFLNEEGKEENMEGIAKELHTHSEIPLFSLLMPNLNNNIDENNGLGLSIYADALDQLKGSDITYNNYVQDTALGGKKVFYNKTLLNYRTVEVGDGKGNIITKEVPIYPDDITKQQFQILGDEFANSSEDTLIQEYNPSLRVSENKENVNLALNLLSFKCGLGKGYYKFENGTITTATQYLGENKDLVNNAKKHRAKLNDYVVGVARSALLVGRLLYGMNLDENDEINLTDKDGFLISDEELRQQWREDYNMGFMSKKEYLMKARGMSEEQALQTIAEINADNPTTAELLGE